MDWANFSTFFVGFFTVLAYLRQAENLSCSSPFCTRVGFRDDWEIMSTAYSAKFSLSLCITIQ